VFCVIETNNIEHFYKKFQENGLNFVYPIKDEFWGKNALFEDLYGNKWDLVETPTKKHLPEKTDPILMFSLLTLLVNDVDEAKDWYVTKLGFQVLSDNTYGDGDNLRWLEIGPSASFPAFTVVAASTQPKKDRVGQQFFLLNVDDMHSFYTHTKAKGVEYHGIPKEGCGGIDAQFKDLYGNRWNVRESTKIPVKE